MIEKLSINNLKCFKKFEIDFKQLNLLVGGNNSGKTSIFHALQLVFWCMKQTADVDGSRVVFKKTQLSEVGAIPVFNFRDLFYQQRQRTGRFPTRINIEIKVTKTNSLKFDIYRAFSTNLMIDGNNQRISKSDYENLLAHEPVYVPGTIGITTKEELYREVAQERLVLEGRQNQVLRNLVFRLKRKSEQWPKFVELVSPLFKLEKLDVPFDEKKDEWLTATYTESGCQYDFVSAGSGFLQVINLLSFIFLHESRVALLDEPDSHMHEDLQRLTFDLLTSLSNKHNIQLIIATHSPIFVDSAGMDNILLIDRIFERPLRATNPDSLVPLLADRGLSLPPNKIINTLKSRRVLFVESKESDFENFIAIIGELIQPNFRFMTRGLILLETTGSTKSWPFDAIQAFKELIGAELEYIYVSDPDFLLPEEIIKREEKAMGIRQKIFHLKRRNRESYLIEPTILERTLINKWRQKHGAGKKTPDDLKSSSIRELILNIAKDLCGETESKYLVFHEQRLRLPAHEKQEETKKLIEIFKEYYFKPLENKTIPYRYLDSKETLKRFRDQITRDYSISFSDVDVLRSFGKSDLNNDLKDLVKEIMQMFKTKS